MKASAPTLLTQCQNPPASQGVGDQHQQSAPSNDAQPKREGLGKTWGTVAQAGGKGWENLQPFMLFALLEVQGSGPGGFMPLFVTRAWRTATLQLTRIK